MNVEEICNRPERSEYTEEEMSFVVEQYILELKEKQVKINIKKGLHPKDPLTPIAYVNQLTKLTSAFNVAEKYFKEKFKNQ